MICLTLSDNLLEFDNELQSRTPVQGEKNVDTVSVQIKSLYNREKRDRTYFLNVQNRDCLYKVPMVYRNMNGREFVGCPVSYDMTGGALTVKISVESTGGGCVTRSSALAVDILPSVDSRHPRRAPDAETV